MGSSSSIECDETKKLIYTENNINKSFSNPRPDNYTIKLFEQIGNHVIIQIQYHDCTNYEGLKILVFENCTIKNLTDQKLIDPHFSEDKRFFSPVARFEPTPKGWDMACELTNILF